jgi:two-component system, OmpR family, phosphate regulon sensor histidine kinase PhoR
MKIRTIKLIGFYAAIAIFVLLLVQVYLITIAVAMKEQIHMWGILLTSAFFSGVLIYIFIYTFSALVREKKLTDLKYDLLNNITHEFKTPVSTISLACEALSDKEIHNYTGIYNKYVNIIKEENRRLGEMAESVLRAAVIEKGELKINKEDIDVHELLNEVICIFNPQVEKQHARIKTAFNAYNDRIKGDKTHLSSAFYNLLDNAMKYTDTPPQILVSTENIDEGIIISFSDNGIGISRENQKKIFDNLFRVPTGNIHDVKGYGLGLGFVKAVVDHHGGSISVESELKKGTLFKILLPFN